MKGCLWSFLRPRPGQSIYTHGRQITLRAAANFYNIEIVIVSTLGPDA